MISHHWVFAAASAALGVSVALGALRIDRRVLLYPAVVAATALFIMAIVVRAISVEPTLIHADVAAPLLVDCVLNFPDPCTNRGASYGQYGFWLAGALTKLIGRDLGAIFQVMQAIGALSVALLAILAYRLSGSPFAPLFAVAITGTNPIFMRAAASEDMHTVGLFLGILAFVSMDVFAATRRTAPLAAAVLALCLMMHTRQTFYLFAPCAFLLGLARGGRDLLKTPAFWLGGLLVFAVLAQRTLTTGDSGDLPSQIASILTQPVLLPTLLRYHGLFDSGRFGLLPILTIASIIWAAVASGSATATKSSDTPGNRLAPPTPASSAGYPLSQSGNAGSRFTIARAAAIAFALNFVITLPCGMPSPGVEFAQRLPAHALGLLLTAIGTAAFVEKRIAANRRLGIGFAMAAVLTCIPPLFPGWAAVSAITVIHREYLAVESAAAALPAEFTQVVLPEFHSNSYGDARYKGLLERLGKKVETSLPSNVRGMRRPWIFLENVECWTYSFYEVIGIDKETARHQQAFEHRWDLVLFARQPSPLRPPAKVRTECEPLLRSGVPIGQPRVISDVEDDPPFLFYASSTVPIQFYELASIDE